MSPNQFQGHPHSGQPQDPEQRIVLPAARHQGETTQVEGQIGTGEEHHQHRQRRRDAAILVERIIHPVKGAKIVHQPADAAQSKRFFGGPVAQRQEQRHERHPGKGVPPNLRKSERQKNTAYHTKEDTRPHIVQALVLM